MFAIIKRFGGFFKLTRIFVLALIGWFVLPAGAAQYTFPGNLPAGCVDNMGGNYTCGSLVFAAGDRVSFRSSQPTIITFEGALDIGANAFINTGPDAAKLTLIIKGGSVLGADSVLNASIQTLGAGDVTLGANSEVTGAISTQTGIVSLGASAKAGDSITTTTGYVGLGARAIVSGNIATTTGYVAVGANASIDGSVTTTTGYVTLGVSAVVGGLVATGEAGYVVLGASAKVNGNIVVRGEGYVTLGDSAVAGGDISTVYDAITLGANSRVTGSVTVSQTGAVTLGASSVVGGNITTEVGAVTIGADSLVGGAISGTVSINNTGDISIGAGSKVYAICCKGVDDSCVTNGSGVTPPPLICPVSSPTTFECVQTGVAYNNPLINPSLKNRLYTKLAGTAFTLDLIALKTDGSVANNYAGAASRNVSLEFVNGEGSGICSSRSEAEPNASQVLTFNAADAGRKTATVILRKSHANLRCRVTDANQSKNLVGCSTDNFSVRPSAVVLQAPMTTTMAPSSILRPAIAAGANFDLRAFTTTGSNYSGQLRLDTNKLSAQIPSQDTFVQNGGTVGLLQPSALQANAAAQSLGKYGEVGYLYLAPGAYRDDEFTAIDAVNGDCITRTANNENYLADTLIDGKYGCSVGTQTPITWGRFYPDYLSITSSALTAACNTSVPYTYFAENGLTTQFLITAKNTSGETTKNYSAAFAKFNLDDYFAYEFNAALRPEGSVLTGNLTIPKGKWVDGTAQIVVKHQVSRPKAPVAETFIRLTANPSDGETNRAAVAAQIGDATRLRYGRLQLKNAYGSELLALPLSLEAQYWTQPGYYITNPDDSCTIVSPNTIVMRNYIGDLKPCKTQLLPTQAFKLVSGKLPVAGIVLTKPGIGNGGSVDLSINLGSIANDNTCLGASESFAGVANQPWFGSDATARATFGIYKSKKIYTRENY